ncbi:MAG: 3-oxoacyl-[acyl-carrier protein] reductase [Streptosporangiaceae bacterium]|jgi:3-oxoacyl-[acyl-carrier protein] reductase|nr:3-oxoacyl-[acyl-carrier protein] reductase [Streptosporangiaceae bacterium]
MRFADRTVVITGAAGGLGSGMATAFAAEGAAVALVDLPDSPGEEVAGRINAAGTDAPGRAFFAPCDLADLAAARQLITDLAARQGGLDVLINNAAIYPRKEVAEYSTEDWQAVQRVNVDAAFVCAQAALPAMRAAGSGRIINVSSITFFGHTPFLVPYVASKGALVGLTRALAREVGQDGITVNAIAPGAYPTAAEAIHPDLESYNAFILEQQAVKRRGTPADIANAALFLAAPETSFVTGQLLVVDGGWVMN